MSSVQDQEQAEATQRCVDQMERDAVCYEGEPGWYYDSYGKRPSSRGNKAHWMEPWSCSIRMSEDCPWSNNRVGWMFFDLNAGVKLWPGTLVYSPLCVRGSRKKDRWGDYITKAPKKMSRCKVCLKKKQHSDERS